MTQRRPEPTPGTASAAVAAVRLAAPVRLGACLVVLFAGAGCSADGDRQPELPEPESLTIPQQCEVEAPPAGVRTVQVVFSCDEVPVNSWREVPAAATDTVRHALEALLAGPLEREREAGLASFFSPGTAGMLNEVAVRDGVAYVDFRDFSGVIPNASASAGSAQLLDQIAGTLFQFDGIREAELSFDGSCDAFWNWLQRGCQRLARGTSEE